LTLTRKVKKC